MRAKILRSAKNGFCSCYLPYRTTWKCLTKLKSWKGPPLILSQKYQIWMALDSSSKIYDLVKFLCPFLQIWFRHGVYGEQRRRNRADIVHRLVRQYQLEIILHEIPVSSETDINLCLSTRQEACKPRFSKTQTSTNDWLIDLRQKHSQRSSKIWTSTND